MSKAEENNTSNDVDGSSSQPDIDDESGNESDEYNLYNTDDEREQNKANGSRPKKKRKRKNLSIPFYKRELEKKYSWLKRSDMSMYSLFL